MTTKELSLVLRLRQKMGDYPTKMVTNEDVGKNVYFAGVLRIAVQGDIGKLVYIAENLVWMDEEYLTELNSARVILFKGKVTSLETLTEFEEECIVLQSRINKLIEVATDSTRYAKYSISDTQAEKLSPTEIIEMAKALTSMLKNMIDEGSGGSSELGAFVEESQYQRYDKFDDLYVPYNIGGLPSNIPFSLEKTTSGILIVTKKIFIPKYYTHYLYRGIAPNMGTIIQQWYTLAEISILDEDVILGNIYKYTLCVEDVNGNVNTHFLTMPYES